jgi:DNA repair protein RadC
MEIRELPPESRPREKMFSVGPENLSDEELLAILISSGGKAQSVIQIAQAATREIDKNEQIKMDNLLKVKGLGKAKACIIAAALELGRRKSPRENKKVILDASDAFSVIRHYASRSQEQFIVLGLNGAHEVLCVVVAAVGTVNECHVHPRDVFAPILEKRGVAIIIAHNHPSENLNPSQPDLKLTERIVACGEILGIKVLDHLIFCEGNYYSFAAKSNPAIH